jgi:hypothetical protein
MTRVCLILPLLLSLPAMASTYTVTAPHLTMHVGDPVPPAYLQYLGLFGQLCQSLQW